MKNKTKNDLSATPVTRSVVTVTKLEAVDPLQSDFANHSSRDLPTPLDELLFKRQADDPDESSCFALLDAAQLTNLPEMLEQSELEHGCLFVGDESIQEVAPWLVRLKPGAAFTNNLFTAPGAPWHLWGCGGAIFLRCSGSFDDIWCHFRKFTKVRDENDNWVFVRFWDQQVLTDYLTQSIPVTAFGRALLWPDGRKARYIIPCGHDIWKAELSGIPSQSPGTVRLTQRDKDMLSVTIRRKFRRDLRALVGQRADKSIHNFEAARLDYTCDKAANFVHMRSGIESASVRDAASLAFILLLMGDEEGDKVLEGPVLNNPHISMTGRIEMTAKSFMTALKRATGGEVI